eukprot:CAMPEP_0171213086 /NCGR_PEP_ID=MMETSP0790-20130122/30464_1 /TAXON_ID=2925 /ORGANISM="Alexandrium catenella, Strain OF101" /LENGTH=140 /DNA_ID=CAMNT_0011678785 /DNA_START=37 /DNA_END=455 /DNA_ORIENTATION=-
MTRSPLAALGALCALWAQAAAWGDGADALTLLQGAVKRQPTPARALKHTLRCGGGGAAARGARQYAVDDGQAARKGKGVGYHFSKSLQDRDIRTLAHWGTVVTGADQGDGWLLVGECYLPMQLEGRRVLRPVPEPEPGAA